MELNRAHQEVSTVATRMLDNVSIEFVIYYPTFFPFPCGTFFQYLVYLVLIVELECSQRDCGVVADARSKERQARKRSGGQEWLTEEFWVGDTVASEKGFKRSSLADREIWR
jgi:hypothetical protein